MGAISTAVVFEQPGKMALRPVQLPEPHSTDCVVEVHWTGISTGTERLLWDGRMPPFPGLAYPLVPGYESVGRVVILRRRDTTRGRPASIRSRQSRIYRCSRSFRRRSPITGSTRRAPGTRCPQRWNRKACSWRWPRPPAMPCDASKILVHPS